MIKNTSIWLRGISRFSGFQLNIPLSPNENHVQEYHSIIAEFESATDDDFSVFKIKDIELNHPGPQYPFFEPTVAGYRYCDPAIFKARVSGLIRYVIALAEVHTGRPTSTPPKIKNEPQQKPVSSNTYNIGTMLGSQFVAGSPNTSIRNTFDAKSQEFRDFVRLLKETAPKLDLEQTASKQLNADIATIEAQIESPAPKYVVIGESISSIKSILEGIAANVLTNGLFLAMNRFLT